MMKAVNWLRNDNNYAELPLNRVENLIKKKKTSKQQPLPSPSSSSPIIVGVRMIKIQAERSAINQPLKDNPIILTIYDLDI